MDIFRVSFAGHRNIYGQCDLEDRIQKIAEEIICNNDFVEFYVGRNGEFDEIAASLVKLVQRATQRDNSTLTLVLPYPVKDLEYYEKYYDDIIIYEAEEKPHPKRAITDRNRWMVDQADLVIAYVDKQEGGAYQAMKYAQCQLKELVLLQGRCD